MLPAQPIWPTRFNASSKKSGKVSTEEMDIPAARHRTPADRVVTRCCIFALRPTEFGTPTDVGRRGQGQG